MTDSPMTEPPLGVHRLDLRGSAGAAPPPTLAGQVLVLDDAASLLDHWDVYLSLVSDRQITGVICLAIGESAATPGENGTREPVVLRIPAVLPNGGGAVLWIGDDQGVSWGTGRNQPRPLGSEPGISLDRLLAALGVPEVFDAVRHEVLELPGRAASPGLVLFSAATDPDELTEARASAVRELTTVWPEQPTPRELRDAIALLGADPRQGSGAVLGPPVTLAARNANEQLQRAEQSARTIGSPRLFWGPDRAGSALAVAVARAGEAAQQYRNVLGELLNRIDGQLRRGDTTVAQVVEMGAGAPLALSPPVVADGLCTVVQRRLAQEPSLAALGAQLRREATARQPQGCPQQLAQLRQMGSLQREFPTSRRWPIPLSVLPLVLLSCAVAAFAGAGDLLAWITGAAVALGWAVPGWLLLARWPSPHGERGLDEAGLAFVTFLLAGLLGTAAAVTTRHVMPVFAPSTQTRQLLIAGVVGLVVLVVVLCWRSAAKRLVSALALDELRSAIQRMTDLAHQVVRDEWQPSERNRVVAGALNEAADGLLEISQALRELSSLPAAPAVPIGSELGSGRLPRALPAELRAVVREDLVRLSGTALEPAWQAIEVGRRTDSGTYARRAERLLAKYDAQVQRAGLMSLPGSGADGDLRSELLVRMWSESPAARDAVRIRDAEDMVQLCTGRQLSDLSGDGEPSMVRFAPGSVRPILDPDQPHRGEGPQGLHVVWTTTAEFAGALRLLPLRPAAICTEQGGGLP